MVNREIAKDAMYEIVKDEWGMGCCESAHVKARERGKKKRTMASQSPRKVSCSKEEPEHESLRTLELRCLLTGERKAEPKTLTGN